MYANTTLTSSATAKGGSLRPVPSRIRNQEACVDGNNLILAESVTELETIERTASIVFPAKKDALLQFYVGYQKLNDVTIRDSYPLPRIV